jgi:hypothetical protein
MSQKRMTRRDALGMMGRTGVMFGAGAFFYLNLEISPLRGEERAAVSPAAGAGQLSRRPGRTKIVPEKASISGSGQTVVFRISGPPGRHCSVAFSKTDELPKYRGAGKAYGVIGQDGSCTIRVNVKDLPNDKVYLRVVTGAEKGFRESVSVTKAFVVHVSDGQVSRFEGVRSSGSNKAPAPPVAAVSED